MVSLAERILAHTYAAEVEAALECGALLFELKGELYAARYERPVWWVYELSPGSGEYTVDEGFTSCTCPAEKPCNHMIALKYNPEAGRH